MVIPYSIEEFFTTIAKHVWQSLGKIKESIEVRYKIIRLEGAYVTLPNKCWYPLKMYLFVSC